MRRLNVKLLEKRLQKLEGSRKLPIQRIIVSFGNNQVHDALTFMVGLKDHVSFNKNKGRIS